MISTTELEKSFCLGFQTRIPKIDTLQQNLYLLPVANKRFKRLPSGRIQYHGETFAGFNKPKRAPKGSKKKFVVLGKEGDKIKKVSYGHRDYSDFTKHKNPKRRANFRARHNCKTAKDKTTARHWACKHLW